MKQATTALNRNKVNLIIDCIMFVGFLVAMAPHFSGLTIHEWLGLAFGAMGITHLVLHWQWLVEVTKRFFGKVQWSARINYILNTLLFIDVTVIILSGLMISEVALPLVGITATEGGIWHGLHGQAADLFLFLTGLHVALHWKWIVNMFKKYVFAPRSAGRTAQPVAGPQPKA